jgi:Tautomerase enzyme
MPLVNVRLIEGVFTPEQKREMIHQLTDRIHIRRLVGVLTGLAAALAAAVAGAPAAFAQQYPPPGQLSKYEPVAHQFNGVTGGVTGWQIALIAVGAAILGAVVAVLVDRARAARRHRLATA